MANPTSVVVLTGSCGTSSNHSVNSNKTECGALKAEDTKKTQGDLSHDLIDSYCQKKSGSVMDTGHRFFKAFITQALSNNVTKNLHNYRDRELDKKQNGGATLGAVFIATPLKDQELDKKIKHDAYVVFELIKQGRAKDIMGYLKSGDYFSHDKELGVRVTYFGVLIKYLKDNHQIDYFSLYQKIPSEQQDLFLSRTMFMMFLTQGGFLQLKQKVPPSESVFLSHEKQRFLVYYFLYAATFGVIDKIRVPTQSPSAKASQTNTGTGLKEPLAFNAALGSTNTKLIIEYIADRIHLFEFKEETKDKNNAVAITTTKINYIEFIIFIRPLLSIRDRVQCIVDMINGITKDKEKMIAALMLEDLQEKDKRTAINLLNIEYGISFQTLINLLPASARYLFCQ